MLRRRPLVRTAARTAVIAGTATAVSGRVAQRQQAAAVRAAEAQAYEQQQAHPPPPAAPSPPPATAPSSIEQLTALAALREQGVLTDAEFESEKAKILNR